MSKGTFKKLALGTALAAIAGYLAGLLTAPKSGKETREDLKDTATKGVDEVEKQLKNVQSELSSLIDHAKEKGESIKGSKARKDFDAALETAKASKDKAQEVLGALRGGNAKDQDLKKALKDASSALAHIRTYITK